jgi:N-acetylglucosaminyldiphosphoundecaprenol N-acetyl-beta-D-mannosaminyltransferase
LNFTLPPSGRPHTVNVLGVDVSAINLDSAVGFISRYISEKRRIYVCVTGAHGLIESQDDPELMRIHNDAGLVTPDGMPVVWMCRRLGERGVDRVYGPDLLLTVCDRLRETDTRHYFYGGAPGVAEELAERLQNRYPGLNVSDVYCPPFRELSNEELSEICDNINRASPDIVWVGLSSPKQEFWMSRARKMLDAPVLIGVGAAFDFHSGRKRQAPLWIRKRGLEWLFRSVTEPLRLGPRYAKIVPRFAYLALRQLIFVGADAKPKMR